LADPTGCYSWLVCAPTPLGPICHGTSIYGGVTLNLFVDCESLPTRLGSGPTRPRVPPPTGSPTDTSRSNSGWSQILPRNTSEIAEIRDGGRRFTLRGESDFFQDMQRRGPDQTFCDRGVVRPRIKYGQVFFAGQNDSVVETRRHGCPQSGPPGCELSISSVTSMLRSKGKAWTRLPVPNMPTTSDTLDYIRLTAAVTGTNERRRAITPTRSRKCYTDTCESRANAYGHLLSDDRQLGAGPAASKDPPRSRCLSLQLKISFAPGKSRSLFRARRFPAEHCFLIDTVFVPARQAHVWSRVPRRLPGAQVSAPDLDD